MFHANRLGRAARRFGMAGAGGATLGFLVLFAAATPALAACTVTPVAPPTPGSSCVKINGTGVCEPNQVTGTGGDLIVNVGGTSTADGYTNGAAGVSGFASGTGTGGSGSGSGQLTVGTVTTVQASGSSSNLLGTCVSP